ncbi:MAG: Fic family protein [Bacteroidales bacterium]|nr:Fic family protein [Bacteroidales bacterium]
MAQKYLWQDEQWPAMRCDDAVLAPLLAEVNMLRGRLAGTMMMCGLREKCDSMLTAMTSEVSGSAEIEGELLNRNSVRSSIARQLGLDHAGLPVPDHYTEGVVQVMLDATHNYRQELTPQRLFGWHAALFPTGYSGMCHITVGAWRTGSEAMQVVSGAMGKEKVHFEAPPSDAVEKMMTHFLQWVNNDSNCIDPIVRAAVAHLWFVTIHPFDDGNGRIGRTITEWLLARADGSAQRFYSLSAEILSHRNDYYHHLENAQKGSIDVTEWVAWFLSVLRQALLSALATTGRISLKTRFWDAHRNTPLNDRQRKVLNRLLDGFDGNLTSTKWYKINHCSQDTASRDINDLIAKNILQKAPGSAGRNTHYQLCLPSE